MFTKTHIRKTEGKTQAHHFCISECSIGKQIKQLGNEKRILTIQLSSQLYDHICHLVYL